MNSIPGTNPTGIPGANTIDKPDYLTTVWKEVGKHYDNPVDTSSLQAVSTPLPVPLSKSLEQYGLGVTSNEWTGYQADSYKVEQKSEFPDGNLGGVVSDILSDLYDNSEPDGTGGNPPHPPLVVTYDPFMDYDDDDDSGQPGGGGCAQAELLTIKH